MVTLGLSTFAPLAVGMSPAEVVWLFGPPPTTEHFDTAVNGSGGPAPGPV